MKVLMEWFQVCPRISVETGDQGVEMICTGNRRNALIRKKTTL
jgi:hypothetical protein